MIEVSQPVISSFRGDYAFLSNFHPSKVRLAGVEYPTVEHAFQASKCGPHSTITKTIAVGLKTELVLLNARQFIADLPSPGAAKRIGRHVRLRSDWESVKVDIMHDLLRQKFSDPVLGAKLVRTGDAYLVEGNTWGDRFWGQVNGVGENYLGVLLMMVRGGLRGVLTSRDPLWDSYKLAEALGCTCDVLFVEQYQEVAEVFESLDCPVHHPSKVGGKM